MSERAELLERELVEDLASLEERFADEEFSTELYRALTNNAWHKDDDGPDGHLSLSWGRAEEIVNELRARGGQSSLALAQTGREGEISDLVVEELARLGWRARALNTSRHDSEHLSQPEAPPPAGQGERRAPVGDSSEWERLAHDEADRTAGGAASRIGTSGADVPSE